MSWSDWVYEGPLRQRYKVQPTGSKHTTELVRELNQPDASRIYQENQEMAKAIDRPANLSFGRWLGRIPKVDYYRLRQERPEIFSNDPEIARPALIRFWNSPEAAAFRVQRA